MSLVKRQRQDNLQLNNQRVSCFVQAHLMTKTNFEKNSSNLNHLFWKVIKEQFYPLNLIEMVKMLLLLGLTRKYVSGNRIPRLPKE